jgi:hypothetical protein
MISTPQFKLSHLWLAAGGVLALVGLLIFVGQVVIWLRIAEWHPFSVAALFYELGIPEPHPVFLGWMGLQKIIDSLIAAALDLPASLVLIGIGGVLASMSEKEAKREAEQRAGKDHRAKK